MTAVMAQQRLCFMLLIGCLFAGCTDSAVPVTLAALVSQQSSFDGQRVRTAGTLREFEPPYHVWIEDAGLNRVELLPADKLQAHVGQRVEVVGRFSYAAGVGRQIRLEVLEPAAAD